MIGFVLGCIITFCVTYYFYDKINKFIDDITNKW